MPRHKLCDVCDYRVREEMNQRASVAIEKYTSAQETDDLKQRIELLKEAMRNFKRINAMRRYGYQMDVKRKPAGIWIEDIRREIAEARREARIARNTSKQ
ncbi:hypothetical protein GCM10025857_06540 [Alicyclobacillus contaminans]|nr:hypothetical protein GCM10025857_06540 [Alicyclobacillus contaminans]